LAAVSVTLSLRDDPFFSPVFVDEECIKKVIYNSGGSSTGKELIAAIGKRLETPLKEVENVRPSSQCWN
jgi:hypothetical protein